MAAKILQAGCGTSGSPPLQPIVLLWKLFLLCVRMEPSAAARNSVFLSPFLPHCLPPLPSLILLTQIKPSTTALHQYMLSCFGMPIGELWDLARLSHYCKKTKRYSFMLTSAPLNHPCLIGSPCNALAIF